MRQRAGNSVRGVFLTAALLAAPLGRPCRAESCPDDGYAILKRIPSPSELLLPHLPSRYYVPVAMHGDLADEMQRTLAKMNLGPPQYLEVMDDNRAFSLVLGNADYPLETRDLVSGILNPTEMIGIVLSSVLRYRDKTMFAAMQRETRISCQHGNLTGAPVLRLLLLPLGKRFGYSYEDQGATVQESWLTSVEVAIDPVTYCAYELILCKHTRTVGAGQQQEQPADSSRNRYLFEYGRFEGRLVPTRLTLSVNDSAALELSAVYRSVNGSTVFDKRTICYRLPQGKRSCLDMSYGDYSLGKAPALPAGLSSRAGAAYAQRLTQAAELSRRADRLLRSGDIRGSVKVLRKLQVEYPETPQALEARRLLSNLP